MHGSWGNAIDADEAMERMGADVMRWLYCKQPPTQNIRFGYGPAEEVKRNLLTLWNSVSFLVQYANIEEFRPRYGDLEAGPRDVALRPLDRWLVARTAQLVAEATEALEAQLTFQLTRAFSEFVDDLSNWYIRRSRRRFYGDDEAAFRTLWHALAQAVRVVSPVMPFLAEHLWRNLVAVPCAEAPRSVFLAPWPEAPAGRDEELLAEMREVRAVVALGHQARNAAGVKVRQPLRRLVARGADAAARHADEIRDELNVKEVEFGDVEAVEVSVKPNLPLLGPRLGKELGRIRAALQAGEFEWRPDGGVAVGGHDLSSDEILVQRTARQGWALAEEDGVTVALSTQLDPELELEARVRDLIRRVNSLRKEAGLELTDRIVLTLPPDQSPLLAHEEWIKEETLAVEIVLDGKVAISKA
jgi:isoleucyl-tRNA synthetase